MGVCDLVAAGNVTITVNVESCTASDTGGIDFGYVTGSRLIVEEVRLEFLPLPGECMMH